MVDSLLMLAKCFQGQLPLPLSLDKFSRPFTKLDKSILITPRTDFTCNDVNSGTKVTEQLNISNFDLLLLFITVLRIILLHRYCTYRPPLVLPCKPYNSRISEPRQNTRDEVENETINKTKKGNKNIPVESGVEGLLRSLSSRCAPAWNIICLMQLSRDRVKCLLKAGGCLTQVSLQLNEHLR